MIRAKNLGLNAHLWPPQGPTAKRGGTACRAVALAERRENCTGRTAYADGPGSG